MESQPPTSQSSHLRPQPRNRLSQVYKEAASYRSKHRNKRKPSEPPNCQTLIQTQLPITKKNEESAPALNPHTETPIECNPKCSASSKPAMKRRRPLQRSTGAHLVRSTSQLPAAPAGPRGDGWLSRVLLSFRASASSFVLVVVVEK